MTVVITVSTDGKFKVFSSENATLATAISEVINELEDHNIPTDKTKFTLAYDVANSKYAFVAIGRS